MDSTTCATAAPSLLSRLTALTTSPIGLTAAALLTVLTTISIFQNGNHFPIAGRTFVITGGSQGTGLSLSILISSRGGNVVIIARNQAKLTAALSQISAAAREPGKQRFHAISADLSEHREVKRAFDEIREFCGGEGKAPDVVWQVAGGTRPGYFKDMSSERLEDEMKLNYFGAMHTAHNALRLMTTAAPLPPNSPQRHIIFTGSILAFHPLPGYISYSPAKAALRSLADGLRSECLLYDISVSICFPATIYSPGFEIENQSKPELTKILEAGDEGQTCDEVARKCVKGLENGETLVVTSLMGRLFRGAMWGGSPKGGAAVLGGLLECVFASVMAWVWRIVAWWLDGEVKAYKKKLVGEGKNVMEAK